MNKLFKKLVALGAAVLSLATPAMVKAADIVVVPDPAIPAGAHEIWAHSEMGQSFVAEGATVKGGFWVEYSPESAALMPPNATTTELIVKLYEGEGLDSTKLLNQTSLMVYSNQKGFLDVNYADMGIQLVVGNKYTLGISSPYNRGWIIPGVCDYSTVQPTGSYQNGHPFFNGQIVTDETGICDNAFHMLEIVTVQPPAPVEPTPTPTPLPTPSYTVTTRKVELKGYVTEVGSNWIIVKKSKVYFDGNTVLKMNYNTTFVSGQFAQIKGFKNSDGTITATFIEVQ